MESLPLLKAQSTIRHQPVRRLSVSLALIVTHQGAFSSHGNGPVGAVTFQPPHKTSPSASSKTVRTEDRTQAENESSHRSSG